MAATASYHPESLLKELSERARELRLDSLAMIHRRGAGHPGGSLSAAEIVAALFFHKLRIDPARPDWPDRDRFILSKGHASAVLYAALARRGYFPREDLEHWGEVACHLQGHPDRLKTPGVDMTAGLLGHGIPVGVGLALAGRMQKRDYRTYVLLGDGECQGGVMWEGAMAAAKFRVSTLTAILDYNDVQLDGAVHDIMPLEPLIEKWRAFNWAVLEINGHNLRQVLEALDTAGEIHGRPTIIVAHTTKGKGVSFMEDRAHWHGAAPNDAQLAEAQAELPEELVMSTMAIREGYGRALAEYGQVNPNLVVLDADTSSSTLSSFFAGRFPDRFFNVGIAEPCMVDMAVGLALGGKVPFVNGFAALLSLRAMEQVRTCVCYARTNVKLAASYAGVSDFKDGPTHHSITDIALMRALPEMTVIVAADAAEAARWVPIVAEHEGPTYLRLSRGSALPAGNEGQQLRVGRGLTLRNGRDVTIAATGTMVGRSLLAADELASLGVAARVLELHTVKPLDHELICQAAEETGALVTAEEHSIVGGLGGAVAEALSAGAPAPLERVGIADQFARTGPDPEALMDAFGLSVGAIVRAAQRAMARKRAGR